MEPKCLIWVLFACKLRQYYLESTLPNWSDWEVSEKIKNSYIWQQKWSICVFLGCYVKKLLPYLKSGPSNLSIANTANFGIRSTFAICPASLFSKGLGWFYKVNLLTAVERCHNYQRWWLCFLSKVIDCENLVSYWFSILINFLWQGNVFSHSFSTTMMIVIILFFNDDSKCWVSYCFFIFFIFYFSFLVVCQAKLDLNYLENFQSHLLYQ